MGRHDIRYKYDDINNRVWITGPVINKSNQLMSPNGGRFITLVVKEQNSGINFKIFAWDNLCDSVKDIKEGEVISTVNYMRAFKREKTDKVEWCPKAISVIRTQPIWSICGEICCTFAHIKRGKGNSAFTLKPYLNQWDNLIHCIMPSDSSLWDKVTSNNKVHVMGNLDLNDPNRVLLYVTGIEELNDEVSSM